MNAVRVRRHTWSEATSVSGAPVSFIEHSGTPPNRDLSSPSSQYWCASIKGLQLSAVIFSSGLRLRCIAETATVALT